MNTKEDNKSRPILSIGVLEYYLPVLALNKVTRHQDELWQCRSICKRFKSGAFFFFFFFCPVEPVFVWVLSETATFKIAAATTIIVCPVAILLNILVILAAKMKSGLKEHNLNILLASLAVADVLMSSISMPVTIALDALLHLKHFLSPKVFCRIAFLTEIVLHIFGSSSTYHLALIAWERYGAVRKWTQYKLIVTRGRVKKYARVAWLLTVLISTPPSIMKISGVQYKYLKVVSIVGVLPCSVYIILIVYFYILIYLGVRKRDSYSISRVHSLIKAKLATKVAKMTAILTAVVLISISPSLVVVIFGEAYPPLSRSSYFRWLMLLAHPNSVFNPVLYYYRDRRYRDAVLEMFKMRKPAAGVQRKERRITTVSPNCGSITHLSNTDYQRKVKRERLASTPSCKTNRVVCVEIHQPKIITTKQGIQVNSGVATKGSQSQLGDTSDQPHASRFQALPQPQASNPQTTGSRHHYHDMIRSKSLDEHALFEMIGSRNKCQQEAIRRPKTAP